MDQSVPALNGDCGEEKMELWLCLAVGAESDVASDRCYCQNLYDCLCGGIMAGIVWGFTGAGPG